MPDKIVAFTDIPTAKKAYEQSTENINWFHMKFCLNIIEELKQNILKGKTYFQYNYSWQAEPSISIKHPTIKEFEKILLDLGYKVKMYQGGDIKIEIWWYEESEE